MQLLTNRYYWSKRWCYSMSSLVKKNKKITWAAGYSNPNFVSRRGSRIYPMQARLNGREVTFRVMYLSGFKVPCTEVEKCGVDSPLDKAWLTCTTLQHAPAGWQIWLSCRPPQSLVVYMTPSNYAIGLIIIIMPKHYWNFRECLKPRS